ncbi:hypothetical protein G3N57_14880, partial [Paraburkholderia sp. Se-20369]|nr:hypothetical protein [Paraburkholderia sp. Se-20369]
LWAALKAPTARRMKDGALTLARIWEAAWAEGRKDKADPAAAPFACEQQDLMDRYEQADFVRSYKLQSLTLDASKRHLVPL